MKPIRIIWLSLVLTGVLAPRPASSQEQVHRKPAVAGSFYPADPGALESELTRLFEQAGQTDLNGDIRFLIVPHAGYTYSGPVAAQGYRCIPRDARYRNIFILASSHREQFEGVSVYAAGNYITPLGEAEVNVDLANELIARNRGIRYLPEAHDREHSIEVQIPFLQHHFEELPPLVPIVMGNASVSSARDLAAALHPWFTPENLFIISSDFSHYPSYQDAVRIDRITADAIATGDPQLFYNTLRKNSREAVPNLVTPACAWSSILTVLYMSSSSGLEITPVLYRNSGDSPGGEMDRVVGYWAIAGHSPDAAAVPFSLGTEEKEALLALSRETLEAFVRDGTAPPVSASDLPPALRQPAGAFVSLYAGGRLRGCIGEFGTALPLYEVVRKMTVAAASKDPRFVPVESPELPYLSIEVSVLSTLKRIRSIDEFQLGRHGIYMTRDGSSGTYLPQVARSTGWSKEEFLGHCSRDKAGWDWEGWKSADLYTYEAIVFGEDKKE